MTVCLNDMESADYEDFLQITIHDYADSKVRNKAWLATNSVPYTIKAFNTLLPEGRETKDQYFRTILHNNEKAGYLWFEMRRVNADNVVFINYIYILPQSRKSGIGKETIALLKKEALTLGAHRIELHVFGFNTTAIELYMKSGFEQTNIMMRYELGQETNED